ncbi:hypothetical protein DVH24_003861 [Malus domestica]|uniref:Uncharacterized protein n=1 Tax=Malus domestica TaxID=3750 RepID=A0A498K4N1_MALDO|nr:hypothetical protein DVH24_003861 [Malus domestica]
MDEEDGESQNANEYHFDILGDSHSIFSTQVPNEKVQDDQDVAHHSAYLNIESEERNVDITNMDATKIDWVINDVKRQNKMRLQVPQLKNQSLRFNKRINSSSARTGNATNDSKYPNSRIRSSDVSLTSGTSKNNGRINSSKPSSPSGIRSKCRINSTGEEKGKCENSKDELTQEELLQSQIDPAKYWKKRVKLWLQMLNNDINTCHFKNSVIENIVEENDALEKENYDLKKQNKTLEKEKKDMEKGKNELEKNNMLEQQKKKMGRRNFFANVT